MLCCTMEHKPRAIMRCVMLSLEGERCSHRALAVIRAFVPLIAAEKRLLEEALNLGRIPRPEGEETTQSEVSLRWRRVAAVIAFPQADKLGGVLCSTGLQENLVIGERGCASPRVA